MVDISAYPILNTYALLGNGISSLSTTGTTTITNGVYGTTSGPPPSGFVGTYDSSNAGAAQRQLTDLVTAINSLPTTGYTGEVSFPITYTPGKYGTPSGSIGSINYIGATITLDAQGDSNAQFFFQAPQNITFTGSTSINLIKGATICNVFWVAGGSIGFSTTPPTTFPGFFICRSNKPLFVPTGSNFLGSLYNRAGGVSFTGPVSITGGDCSGAGPGPGPGPQPGPGPEPQPEPQPGPQPEPGAQAIVCYLKGTLILTNKGFVPIENIKAGHKVVTKGKIYKNKYINNAANLKFESVYWVSKFKVINLNSKSRPICIKADALEKNYPLKDLYVSPNHGLLLNGEMVLAKNLVNGTTIYQDNDINDVEYYHLECESHSAIIANGVLSESYFGGNNRAVFENSITLRRRVDFKNIYALK